MLKNYILYWNGTFSPQFLTINVTDIQWPGEGFASVLENTEFILPGLNLHFGQNETFSMSFRSP